MAEVRISRPNRREMLIIVKTLREVLKRGRLSLEEIEAIRQTISYYEQETRSRT